MPDAPDWQPDTPLIAALTTLTTAVNALAAGYGTTPLATATTQLSTVTVNTTSNPLAALGAGHGYNIVSVEFEWVSVAGKELRGNVYPRVQASVSGPVVAVAGLSPENPSKLITVPAGFGVISGTNAVQIDTRDLVNVCSTDVVRVSIAYYTF